MARSTDVSNRSEAVRPTKAVAFPDSIRHGKSSRPTMSPVGKQWDELFTRKPLVSEDFMSDRQQPAADEREPF